MTENNNKILIIDDSPTTLKMLEIILESEGFNVVAAVSGEEGLNKALSEKPDIIISDIMLPGIDGFQVCERIKNNSETKHIPIIMLTGKDQGEDFDKAMDNKADWYIVKPYKAEHLMKIINKLLG